MSIPAMREIRRIFPEANITLHTRKVAEGLFSNASFIDDIISYETSRWPFFDVLDNSSFLKTQAYDIAVLFPNSFESALTVFLSQVPTRIGYNKDLRGFLLTHPVPVPEWKDRRHEVFYYLGLVSEMERRLLVRDTVSSAIPDISLEISSERRAAARELLDSLGVDLSLKTVLLGVGSTNSQAKRWPAESFAVLNDRIQTELRANVVLVGSKGDLDAAGTVFEEAVRKPVNAVGKTSVAEAASIISVADLLISNDMGLAHISPAVGTKTIVIFGPTDPTTTRPFSGDAVIIRNDVPCSPCMLRECPIDHRCMTGVIPDQVFETACQMLEDKLIYEETGSIS
jgi:heptosyltransferase-2